MGLSLFLAGGAAAVSAQPLLTVCPDSSGDYATIQEAVDAAADSAVIELCDGVFTGPGNRDVLLGDRFLTVRSASGDPAACVIDCEGSAGSPHRGFLFRSSVDTCAVLQGLTIRGGWADGGGGVRCESDGKETGGGPLLVDCRIVDAVGGGGVSIQEAKIWLLGCELSGNEGGNLAVPAGLGWGRDCDIAGGITVGSEGPKQGVLQLHDCRVENGDGDALVLVGFSHAALDSCTIAGNGGWALISSPEDADASFTACRIRDNGAGGTHTSSSFWLDLTDCEVTGNGPTSGGAGIAYGHIGGLFVTRCLVADNGGDGIHLGASKLIAQKRLAVNAITDCTVLGNGGWGIASAGFVQSLSVSGTVLAGNLLGGLLYAADEMFSSPLTVASCTIAGNGGPGLELGTVQTVAVGRTIVAGNAGAAVNATAAVVPALSCCDLHGNGGGDWTGPIAGQVDVDGNFSDDPLFCEPEAGDYHLAAISPCAEGRTPAGCDGIGALGVGCDNPASAVPHIVSIRDIPADQGLQVRVVFNRDPHDTLGAESPITRYVVWRRVDQPWKAAAGDMRPEVTSAVAGLVSGPRILSGGETLLLEALSALWEPVGPEVPAMMWSQYASVVPTLADSTAAGIVWSTFLVSAHTAEPQVFFLSAPDSGYSVDNLAPPAPLGFAVTYAAGGNRLQWLASAAPDFVAFRVYRGEGGSFPISQATLVQTTALTEWVDPVADPWRWGYRITAVDDSGLESPVAAPGTVADVPGDGADAALPARPVLRSASPNPFNPRTVLAYALPAGGADVRLEIFDLRGRRLRVLAEGFQDAGPHQAVWNGADDQGRALPAGTYFCRLRAGEVRDVLKVALVR